MARSATKTTRFPPPGRKAKAKAKAAKAAPAKAAAAAIVKADKPSKEGLAFVDRIAEGQKAGLAAKNNYRGNPLKDLEATVKPQPAPKTEPAGTAAKAKPATEAKQAKRTTAPAPKTTGGVKFGDAFARTFSQLLGGHGFKQIDSEKPQLVVFQKNGTTVEITNPSQPGGSKIAPYIIHDGDKQTTGAGRDALADALGVARLKR